MNDIQFAGWRFDPSLAQDIGMKVLAVATILLVTWILAKAAKWSFAKLVDKIPLFQRVDGAGTSVGLSLGRIVSLFIWLFGLIAVLQALGFDSVMAPVQALANNVMAMLPNLIGAGIIFFVGLMIAKILRDIVETALSTVNFDKWANMGGAEAVTGNSRISKTIGTIVFILIIVPVSIAALEALKIESLTTPAVEMLEMVMRSLPLILGASLMLGLGYFIARWLGDMVEEVLPGLGVDRALASVGILPEGKSASGIIAAIVRIAVMLFMAIAATRLLRFPELTNIIETVLAQGTNLIFGAVLIAIGAMLGRMLQKLVASAAGEGFAAQAVYWMTLGLFTFIGLKQMNIGGAIVDYAFVAIVIGAAVAFALAFGLGGREAAAKALNKWGQSQPALPPKGPAKATVKPVVKAATKPAARKAPAKK